MASPVTVGTTPTQLVPAKSPSLRGNVLLQVPPGGQYVYVSRDPAVTVASGFLLRPTADMPASMLIENEALSKPAASAWYGIVAATTQTVIVEEGL